MFAPNKGIGTYQLDQETTYRIVLAGLNLGYRHIDTAFLYRNEAAVGHAIKDSRVPREEIWITTKIWVTAIKKGPNAMQRSIEKSLARLQTSYLDLVLLHSPTDNVEQDWQNLVDIHKYVRVRHIGVSNYNTEQLKSILAVNDTKPYCNQIELSPFLQRRDLVDFCRLYKIVVVAHSSLTKGNKFDHPLLLQLSQKYACSVAVILLSWARAKKFKVIPRTSSEEHLRDNLIRVKLSTEDMQLLDGLEEGYSTHRV